MDDPRPGSWSERWARLDVGWRFRPTGYRNLPRWQAALVLALILAAVVWFQLGARAAVIEHPPVDPEQTDSAMYSTIVERVRAGEGYYDVVGDELRRRNYPVRPMFNWRQPTYAWLLSRLPGPSWANHIMAVLGMFVVVLSGRWVSAGGDPIRGILACGLTALTALTWPLVPAFGVSQEAWAAYFIVLSFCLRGLGHWKGAFGAAMAALAFRELALLPCGVALLLAVRDRRRVETVAWLAGLAVYAALMTWHGIEVSRRFQTGDIHRSWMGFGGATFLVSTGIFIPLLVLLPKWLSALVLPLSLFGLAGWKDPGGRQMAATLGGYFAAFSIVGLACNDYWGTLFAPMLAFGLLWLPDSLVDLTRALTRGRVGSPA
jgi:hypothetical protein